MLDKGHNLRGVKLFLVKKGGSKIFDRPLRGKFFFACVDAARTLIARNRECSLQTLNKYSDVI